MSLRRQAVQGAKWSALQAWGSHGLSLGVFIILANLLPPEDFGALALAQAFVAFGLLLPQQGVTQSLIQRKSIDDLDCDTAFWTNAVAGALLGIACALVGPAAAIWFDEPVLKELLPWLAIGLFVGALGSVQEATMRRDMAFKPLAMRTLLASIIGGAVGISMAYAGFGVMSLVGQVIATRATATVMLWIACTSWRPRLSWSWMRLKSMLGFGTNTFGSAVLSFINRRTDDLLIGAFMTTATLGFYTVAYGVLLRMTKVFTQSVSQVALPTFAKMQDDHNALRNALTKAMSLTSVLAFPAFGGLAAVAPEFVYVVLGERWAPSIPVLQVLSLVGMLQCVTFFNAPALLACGKSSWVLGIRLTNAAFRVTGFLIAVRYGIVAVALAYVVTGILVQPLALYTLRKQIQLDLGLYLSRMLAPLIATMSMYLLILGGRSVLPEEWPLWLLLLIFVLVGAASYASIMLILAPSRLRELLSIASEALPQQTREVDEHGAAT